MPFPCVVAVAPDPGQGGGAQGTLSISLEATSLSVPEPGAAVLAAIGSTGLMLVAASRRWRRPRAGGWGRPRPQSLRRGVGGRTGVADDPSHPAEESSFPGSRS